MATRGIFRIEVFLILGLTLLSCVSKGASQNNHPTGLGGRRGLTDGLDVTTEFNVNPSTTFSVNPSNANMVGVSNALLAMKADAGAAGANNIGTLSAGAGAGAGIVTNVNTSGAGVASGGEVDITGYGAKPDGSTDNSQAFSKAWTAACQSAAKLVIPSGSFLTGPVTFVGPCKGPMVVEVWGTVKATSDITEYTGEQWIMFDEVDNLLLTGTGTFDGQGEAAWQFNDCDKNSRCDLPPHSIYLHRVTNAVVKDISSLNSKGFHLLINFCHNISVQNVNITAPGESPNTDGIHISSSDIVSITNTKIGTGDDCVSIGQGSVNVTVTGVTCGPGHGLSIGSLGKYQKEKDVMGITVTNCTLKNTTNGVRIKTWTNSAATKASSIIFQDIIMETVKNPIIIDQKYGKKDGLPSLVKISDVHFRNIRGSSSVNSAISLVCSEKVPCEGIEFADIDLTYGGIKRNTTIYSSCLNTKALFGGKQNPPACM